MARYIVVQPQAAYIFSAITASVDADGPSSSHRRKRRGRKSESAFSRAHEARFILNDGQHRRAAIEMALRDCPELGG